ncbi:hypothetical protein BJ508DRAFT_311347 [Ascobolus immersus RN42]|uniref:Uncharacterized protein n=1 Tax=Ascobolus immersus RN42 TaxID=1160509 RepID=A0A3N4HWA2_ASCIM|nr:hypothetical protein BJ508DRAFT_311347 [Ascobolus immersus RN42]
MDQELAFRNRLARLRAQQNNYVTRWNAYNARIATDLSSIMHQSTEVAALAKEATEDLFSTGSPQFASTVTTENIEAEEQYTQLLVAFLDEMRKHLPVAEKSFDFLAGPELSLTMTNGSGSRVEYEETRRAGGLDPRVITAAVEFMLAGGLMFDDRPSFGPQPTVEMRHRRLRTKRQDLVQRFDLFIATVDPNYRRPLRSRRDTENAVGSLWLHLVQRTSRQIRQPKLDGGNIQLEERRYLQAEVKLLRLHVKERYLRLLLDTTGGIARESRREKYTMAWKSGGAPAMNNAMEEDIEKWRLGCL